MKKIKENIRPLAKVKTLKKYRNLAVAPEVHERLRSRMVYGDSFSSIIAKLLDITEVVKPVKVARPKKNVKNTKKSK